jgi:hypothetical protein
VVPLILSSAAIVPVPSHLKVFGPVPAKSVSKWFLFLRTVTTML